MSRFVETAQEQVTVEELVKLREQELEELRKEFEEALVSV